MDESGEHRIIRRREVTKRRLTVVPDPAESAEASALDGVPPRPRTIGRLIAQTALLADSAMSRRRISDENQPRTNSGRRFGWFS